MNGNLIAYNDSGVVNLGERMMVKNNTFKANLKCGISYGCSPSGHDDIRTNQFLNSPVNSKAIDLSSMRKTNVIATPVITSVSTPDKDGYVFVNGKVETKEKVKIEIFRSDGRDQDALEYLSCDSTDVNGNFKVKVKAPDQLLLSFIALASKDEYYDLSEFSNTYTVPLKGPFYVKTKREGTGDGSSWENAMDGTDFASVLPLAPDGATFHVAAGTYQPVYDAKGVVPAKKSNLTYLIKTNVTIQGGYYKDAKNGAESDPQKYHTIFDGKTADGNISNMFTSTEDIKQELTFNGITIENTDGNALYIYGTKDKTLHLEKDSFVNNNWCVTMTSEGGQLFANNIVFNKNSGKCFNLVSVDNISLQYVDFTNNSGEMFYSTVDQELSGTLYMDHVNAYSNTASNGFEIYRYNSLIKNCEFVDNKSSLFYLVGNNTSVTISNSKFKENTAYLITNYQTSDLYIDGCDFVNNRSTYDLFDFSPNKNHLYFTNSTVEGNTSNKNLMTVVADILNVENVTFNNNTVGSGKNLINGIASCESVISHNVFSDNKSVFDEDEDKVSNSSSLLYLVGATTICDDNQKRFAKIDRNSILGNDFGNMVVTTSTTDSVILSNNTFASNKTAANVISSDGSNAWLFNNTIVGNEVGYNVIEETGRKISANGNIILGNVDVTGKNVERIYLYYGSLGEVVNNIVPDVEMTLNDCSYFPDESNIVSFAHPEKAYCENFQKVNDRNEEILTTLFKGSFNKSTGLFTPVFDVQEGFPVLALKSDVLADGKSIRFPRLENVLTDQRGESRDDMTCMGAYELPAIDTVFVRDTIVLGKTYVFNDKDITPAKIGIYNDTMVVKKGNKEITHILKLYVKPETSRNYFYVKKKAEGNGTGSSWNNAMSAEDFAFTLPFANSGTKFYVAEGVYNPIYDASGEESDDPTSLCYRIKNNITIYGGYPADAKIGATADPENHPTIFSGDHKGDDKVVKDVDENGRLKLTYSNRGDNSIKLFEANKCDVTFNNVIVDGAASYGINSNGDITRFYGNNVTFQNCDYAVYYTSDKAVIFIDKSKFENISSGCLYTPNGWNTNVTSTVFSGNTGYLAYSASEGMISFDSVTVTGNNAKIYSVNNVELKISNSEFIDNDNSGSLIYVVNKDRETQITKSLFKENKKLILDFDANSSLIIDSCSFIGNTEKLLDIVGSSNTTIGNSIFEKNILPVVDQENEKRENLVSSYGYVDIKSSSFFDNKCGNLVYVTSLDAENNTFVKNDVSSVIYQIYSGDIFRLSNNTIISNRASDYPLYANSSAKAYFYGNVILDNTQDLTQTYRNQYIPGELSEFYNIKEAKFNLMDIIRKNPQTELYDNSTYIPDNNSNIWVKPREITMQEDYDNCGACEYATDKSEEYYLTNLFEGALDSETGRFYPSIKDNGGYTPTVALKSNVLPDGTSITFPRLENVLADQRGELRDDMTCMGAYETTGNDTVFVRDTIVLGKTYVFNEKEITPEKIGVYHDTMVVKKGNKEVAQVLKLYVRPDWLFNCYVKKVAEGTGDGSSWENAMSAEDFAFALPFAAVGAEFYVAEGVYKPLYDASGNETDDPTSLCYRIQNNALIHGGYPADAKTGATPDPENHPTIFSGDHKRDDKVVKGVDENGRLTITYSNREDNSKQLFVSKASVVRLYNVDIEGATSYGISNVRNGNANFEADNSNFRNCDYAVYYPNKDAVVFINKSKFENISSGCLFTPNGWNTNVTSTVFSGNTGYIAYSASEGMMSFDSVTVTGNNAQIYSVNNVELKISNSEFINNDNSGSLIYMVNADRETTSITKSLFKDNKNQIFEFYANTSLDIDSCSFIGNSNRILYAVSGSKTSIGRCVFEKNILPAVGGEKRDLIFSYGNAGIKTSSFFDNECGNLVLATSVDVENSTFVKNDVYSIIFQSNSGDIFRLSNNTIISNRASNYPLHSNSSAEAYLYGNVILDNKLDEEKSATGFVSGELSEFYNIQEVKYNLMDIIRKNPQTETYDMSTYIPDNNTNIFVKPREITTDENYTGCKACEYATDNSEEYYLTNLFEGTLDSKTGTFSPTIQNNGGSTPTVALKNNVLPDGTSITFPRLENVLTDQRGVSRLDETCMGAYEMRCGSDTTFTTDTIYVGEKILSQTFTKVGVHDSIFETLKSSFDCDSVVMHRVVVKPDPKTFNYYVKMKKAGDGDGRDWDNAMDSIDFATYLPLAPDGATFYVAAGTYKPVYDVNMNIPSDLSDLCYAINSSVTIRGGYPADATGTDVPSDPKKYETIFDGDIKGDDVINETSGEDGYVTVKAKNRENNSSYMFFSNSQKGLHVGFDGVYVKNASEAIYILYSDKYVSVSNSKFVLNDNAVFMPYEGENLKVYNTSFSKHLGYVVNMPNASNLTMDSILFENNQKYLIYIPGTPGVNPDHNVRLNRLYAYANGDSSYVVYTIGHDFILSNSEFKNNRGMLYLYDNTRIDSSLFENNFGSVVKYGTLGFEIDECSFIDNKANGSFINSTKNGTELNHFSVTKSSFKNTISNGLFYVVSDSINIEKSEISGSSNGYVDLNGYKKA
ncbi:MAG: right-handed parallel beta-helix repeat-containing protein, partial [Bacteroidales bacterium]|nr:right-handed parallel beta-helix repeat-containing protein [Bacteroidales bacterium]